LALSWREIVVKLDDFKLSVESGDGLIGRFPTAVFLLVGDGDRSEHKALVDLFSGPLDPKKDLSTKLEALFATPEAADVEAFAAVVETANGASLYLHGPVEVSADGPNAEFRVWGPGPGQAPLLRYEAPESLGSLTVRGTGGSGNGAGQSFDLRSGLASGNGLVLERRTALAELAPAMSGAVAAPMNAMANGAPLNGSNGSNGSHRPVATLPPPPPPRVETPPPAWLDYSAQTAQQPARQSTQQPLPEPARSQSAGGNLLRPTYLSRLLTRVIVTLTLGLACAFGLGAVLPVGFAPLADTYLMTLVALGVLFATGPVVFDWVYGLLKKSRRDQDWPAPWFALQAVPEGLLAYGVLALFLEDFVVDDSALVWYLVITAIVVALGTYGLSFIPATRRALLRGGSGSTMTADAGLPGSIPSGSSMSSGPAPTAQVWGINCKQGHFNRPDARYCGACGVAMHGLTHQPVQGARPALGYLVSDDGSAHVLDGDYVVGREPHSDEQVRGGRAKALAVPDRSLSEAHADVRLDEWDVTVVDRGHPSGTYVREPDSTNLIRLSPGQPFTIRSGTQVRVGQRDLVFHALNRR
jgi:hypothetical protein